MSISREVELNCILHAGKFWEVLAKKVIRKEVFTLRSILNILQVRNEDESRMQAISLTMLHHAR